MKINAYRILLMIFSVLLSFVLWLYIMSITDVEGRMTVKEVKVNLTGEESLRARKLEVIYCDPEINLTFTGRRTDLVKLDKNTVSVSLDLSNIISASEYRDYYSEINYPENFNGDRVKEERSPENQIHFFVDVVDTKVVPIKLNSTIKAAEGYVHKTPEIYPPEVRITGPETILAQISSAVVWLEETDVDRTVERTMGYTLVDFEGNKVELDNYISLDCVPAEALITVPVNKTKNVGLDVELIDGGGITKDNVTVSINPETIRVEGDAAALDGLNTITLGRIDLAAISENGSQEYDIMLPNGCESLSGETRATVTIEISGAQTRSMSVTNISHSNADIPEGYEIRFITKSLTVKVRGPNNLVEAVEPFNIRVVADLEDQTLTPGQMTVTADVYVDGFGSGVGAVGSYRVTLDIVPIQEDDDVP